MHIFDVSNVEISAPWRVSLSIGPQTHSSWPTDNGNYLYITLEPGVSPVQGNKVYIWDLTNFPNVPATYSASVSIPQGQALTAHIPVVQGNLLYVSWYQAGLLVYDITSPLSPVQKGQFDTYTGQITDLVEGNWGVYPFLGQDRILASDTDGGLFILTNKKTHILKVDPKVPGQLVFTGKDFSVKLAP